MKKFMLFSTLLITISLISNTLNSQTCFDFENEIEQTIEVTDSNMQILYLQNDITIRASIYEQGILPDCNTIDIRTQQNTGGYTFSNSTFITFCEAAALVDLSDVNYTSRKITYITNSGKFSLLEINGVDYNSGIIPQSITVDTINYSNYTSVEIVGSIDSILLGGFEGGFDDLCISEYITSSISSQNEKFKNSISVYPNPVNNNLSISKSKANSLNNIYDIRGKLVYSGYSSNIDVSNFKSGIYFIKNIYGYSKFIKK